ncbi:HNH endonuclease [Hymenobacter sp.]
MRQRIWPQGHEGTKSIDNLETLCFGCNLINVLSVATWQRLG